MIFIWAKFKGCFCQSMKTLTNKKWFKNEHRLHQCHGKVTLFIKGH